MEVSFGGIGEIAATFKTSGTVNKGALVKMASNDTVAACSANDRFCGVALSVAPDGFATVLLHGFTTVTYTGATAPSVGYNKLLAGAADKVTVNANGADYLVVSVNTTATTACVLL